ncbi:MAG: hypothetical protein NVS3B20_03810 [Polyangiales bacterium]
MYAAIRVVMFKIAPDPNPALVVASARVAMFWRLVVGAYVATLVTIPVYALARRDLGLVVRILSVAAPITAIAIVLQGILVP